MAESSPTGQPPETGPTAADQPTDPSRADDDRPGVGRLYRLAELARTGGGDTEVADALCRAGRAAAGADRAWLITDDGDRALAADGHGVGSGQRLPIDRGVVRPSPAPAPGDEATTPIVDAGDGDDGAVIVIPIHAGGHHRLALVAARDDRTRPFTSADVEAVTAWAVVASLVILATGRSLRAGGDGPDRGPDDPLADLPDEQLWDMLESAPDGMLLVDPHGCLAMVNRQVEALFGYRRNDLIGRPVELLLPERLREVHEAHREAYGAGPVNRPMGIGLDLLGRRADGTEFPVEVSLSPSRRLGSTGEVIVAVRDVTTRTEIEDRLRESQLRFRAAFDDGPVPMALVDITPPADRIIVEANQAMADLVGYGRHQLLGMSFAELTHPDDQARDEEAARNHLCGDNTRYSPTKRYVRADGSIVWVQLHASPLLRRDGGTLCIAHAIDLTDQLEATAIAERHEALDRAVSEIRLAMLRGASREQGLDLITRSAVSCLGAESAVILMPGAGSDVLVEKAASDRADRPALRCHDGVVGEVFRSGRASVHGPADLAGSGLAADVVGSGPADSVVVAPLHDGHETVGVLLVVRGEGATALDATELAHIERFASEAVIAIELADVAEAHQRLELFEDRERIGRDIHDKVIGRLFATGMSLQAMATLLEGDGRERALTAVAEIDEAIQEIRAAIYGIRSRVDWGKGARGEFLAVAAGQRDALGFEPDVDLQGDIDGLERGVLDDLLATLREALSNAAKYARAANVEVSLTVDEDGVALLVTDDGVGFVTAEADGAANDSPLVHHGLRNMAARAERRGGGAEIVSSPERGTTVRWWAPVDID